MIEFKNSQMLLPNKSTLKISGSIADGEIIAIRGPSGCGKSSTLNALALLDENKFEYEIDSQPTKSLSPWELSCGYCFQDAELFKHLNVEQNVRFPLKFRAPYKSWDKHTQNKRVAEFLEAMGILHLKDKSPDTLSGGEAQRVALTRSVIYLPKLLLLDESFSALDKDSKEHIKQCLKNLIKKNKMSCLIVAHSDGDCLGFVDREVQWPQQSQEESELTLAF